MFKELMSDVEHILMYVADAKIIDRDILLGDLNGVLGYLKGMQNVFNEQEKGNKE